MKLKEWLKREGMTHGDFAEKIGVHRTAILRLASDQAWPERETAQAIFDATNGEVTPDSFLGIADETAA